MAEILLEGRDCEACGTPVRKGAIFCYHCGMSVAPDVAVTTDTGKENVSSAWLNEDVTAPVPKNEAITDDSEIIEELDESEIVEDSDNEETIEEADETEIVKETDESEIIEEKTDESEIVEDEIIEDDAEIGKDESLISENEEEEAEDKPKLKSAAAMRRKPKQIQKKRVEIVWDEPVSPPNVWFLIATILFATLAVGLWLVARYLG